MFLYLILFFTVIPQHSFNYGEPEYITQSWNNCGPASLSMIFSAWNLTIDQSYIESMTKSDPWDLHIGVDELKRVCDHFSYSYTFYSNRSIDDLKILIDNNGPVITPIWYSRSEEDQMGHYIVLYGYDQNGFKVMDPLNPPLEYLENYFLYDMWSKAGNRVLSIYPKGYKAVELFPVSVPYTGYDDFYSYYNMGRYYLNNKDYILAAENFTKSIEQDYYFKYLWYNSEIFEAFFYNNEYQKLIDLGFKTLKRCKNLEEVWYWVSYSYYKLNNIPKAEEAINMALKYRSDYTEALQLEKLIK